MILLKCNVQFADNFISIFEGVLKDTHKLVL